MKPPHRKIQLEDHTVTMAASLPMTNRIRSLPWTRRSTRSRTETRDGAITAEVVDIDHDDRVTPPVTDLAHLSECLSAYSAELGTRDRVDAHIHISVGSRQYSDESGRSFTAESGWSRVVVQRLHDGVLHSVTDGSDNIGDLPQLLRSGVAELASRRSLPELVDRPDRPIPLILNQTTAAVLMHELIAHSAEVIPRNKLPVRIGPADLTVSVYHPRKSGHDDQGIPIKPVCLVADGNLRAAFGTRNRQHCQIVPTGLAQAGWHNGPPYVRCTHMNIRSLAPTPRILDEIKEAVVCTGTSGAELIRRQAYVGISAASLIRDGRAIAQIRPFTVAIGLNCLVNKICAIGDDVSLGRSGMCLSNGQLLPTKTSSPTIALRDIREFIM
jgi:predicted Zn-dependent protease